MPERAQSGEVAVRIATMAALTLLTAATTWSATLSWRVLALDPATWLAPAVVVTLAVAGTGILGRALGGTSWLVAPVQILIGLTTISWQLVGTPVPTGERGRALTDQVTHAFELSTRVRPPAPVEGGVLPLLLLGTLIAVVAVDLMVLGLRRSPLAGPLLVAIWAVTFWNGPVRLPWWTIALPAAGFCLLLLTSQVLARWRSAATPGSAIRIESGSSVPVLARATGIGATAIAVAIVVPHIVSTAHLDLLPGGGGGRGERETLTVTNPMVSLKRDLVQGPDTDLLTVHTDDPAPAYLRISALTTFRDNAWTAGERTVPSQNRADGAVAAAAGIDPNAVFPAQSYYYDVRASEKFESRWLPTQPLATTVNARGDWRYDSGTMDFLAADKGLTTQGLSWSMTSYQPEFSTEFLNSLTSTSLVGQIYTTLPRDLPPSVGVLAGEVTSAAASPFAKAVALQEWFRSEGGFTYDTSTDLGDGTDDLTTFLSAGPRGRQGYCQQFATAMAVMARTLHIPARVAVGFLRPEKVAPETWVYSAHDLHAWPELYFAGAGWVRFEPTPSVRAPDVPAYAEAVPGNRPSQPPTTAPTPRSSAGPSVRPTRTPTRAPSSDSSTATASGVGRALSTWVPVVGAGLVLMTLLGAPALLRRRRRRTRLQHGTPEDLWAELRDTAVDLQLPWPDTASVRRQATSLRLDGPSGEALTRLRTGVEESRYAAVATAAAASDDLTTVTASLWGKAGPRTKRRARVMPRSLRRRRG